MSLPDLHGITQALGWTLVHFLWQGAIIGLVFGVVMRLTSAASAWLRYRMGLAIFIGAGLMPVVTFWMVFDAAAGTAAALGAGPVAVQAGGAASAADGTGWLLSLESALEPHLAWAVAFWLAGVIVMSGRVCLDWWQVRRLTWVGVEPLSAPWDARVTGLVQAFGVSRPVRVLRSTVVRVPAVIGWLRPVVLIPAAALAGLSGRQLELIIAHELAHIRRADYLVNLLQVFIETVLFYHPAVRWMSNRVRQERELCCDDAVIATCGDTLTYAQALTELEVQRQAGFQTALAASGGQLSQRIYRMLERPVPRRNTLIWSMSLIVGLAAGSMALAAQMALTGNAAPEAETPSRPAPSETAPEPATPRPPTPDTAVDSPAVEEARPERGRAVTAAAGPEASAPAAPGNDSAPADDAPGSANRAPAGEPAGEEVADDVSDAGPSREPPQPAEQRASETDGDGDASPGADSAVRDDPEPSSSPGLESFAGLEAPAPFRAEDAGGESRQPPRLARTTPPESKAAREARPEIRGGDALHVTAPQYPRRARLRGLQGSVATAFTIDRQGRVRDIEVRDSEPAGVFDHAVVQALENWRFEPMTRDGEPVTRRVSKVFEFNLEGGVGASTVDSGEECDPVTGTRICRP